MTDALTGIAALSVAENEIQSKISPENVDDTNADSVAAVDERRTDDGQISTAPVDQATLINDPVAGVLAKSPHEHMFGERTAVIQGSALIESDSPALHEHDVKKKEKRQNQVDNPSKYVEPVQDMVANFHDTVNARHSAIKRIMGLQEEDKTITTASPHLKT